MIIADSMFKIILMVILQAKSSGVTDATCKRSWRNISTQVNYNWKESKVKIVLYLL